MKSFILKMLLSLSLISNSYFYITKNNQIQIKNILYNKISELENKILKQNTTISKLISKNNVKITFYCPELKGINSDSNSRKTALMQKPVAGWTCAISRDLMKQGYLGKKIYIEGIGIRYANDLMGKTVNGKEIVNQIDICVGKKNIYNEAKKLGKNKRFICMVN